MGNMQNLHILLGFLAMTFWVALYTMAAALAWWLELVSEVARWYSVKLSQTAFRLWVRGDAQRTRLKERDHV